MENTQLKIFRKLVHMINGIFYLIPFIIFGYTLVFIKTSLLLLALSLICMFLVFLFPSWERIFKKLIREDNPIKGIGVPMYLGGMFLACTMQHYLDIRIEILVYAIVTLSMGDGIATIVGKSSLGAFRPRNYPKSYSGMFIGTLLSIAVSYLLLVIFDLDIDIQEICIYTSIGMLIEFLLTSKKSHEYCIDNFAIPIGIMLFSLIIN